MNQPPARTTPGKRTPRLIWVTDRHRARYPLVNVAGDAVAGGVDAIQIRERDLDAAALASLVDQVRGVAGEGATVLVNGNLEVAVNCGLGLHLPERDDLAAARATLGPDALIGRSVHSTAAAQASAAADFLIAGHVFPTASHQDVVPIGLDGLRAIVAASRRPVLAIGGIRADNAAAAIAAGAAGVAVISAINQANDPRGAAAELRAVVDRALEHSMSEIPVVVRLNGRDLELPTGSTIQTILDRNGLTQRMVVAELNGTIVPRAQFAQTTLTPGDEIELVHFVGGG